MRPVGLQAIGEHGGFSLIEVVISVFLLAVGMLGVAGLQLKSLQVSHESRLRSDAVVLVQDLIGRMVLNQSVDYSSEELSPTEAVSSDCFESLCTSAELKEFDLINWRYLLGRNFPGAIARVEELVVGGQNFVQVTIAWKDVSEDVAADLDNVARSFTLVAVK